MRTVTVSHNWYSFPQCSGIAIPTVFGVPSDVSCQDRGRVCWAWSGLVRMKSELGHSLTKNGQVPMYISEKKEMENGLLASTRTHYGGKALHRRWVDYGYIKMGKEWEIKTDETLGHKSGQKAQESDNVSELKQQPYSEHWCE